MKVYICPNCEIELIEKRFDYIMLYYCLECNYKDIKKIAPCCSKPNYQYKKFRNYILFDIFIKYI